MRYVFSVLAALAWALWLGGICGTAVGVIAVFRAIDRAEAGRIGSIVFNAFGRYQLVVAAVALIAAAGLRLAAPGRARTWLFALLGVAAVGASVFVGVVTPRIDAMRAADQARTPEFQRLHKASERIVAVQVLALLAAGAVLPAALRDARGRGAGVPQVAEGGHAAARPAATAERPV